MVAVAQAKLDAFRQCMVNLLIISLLFCLRSCEYTKTNSHRRTTQFRFQDMHFHDSNGVTPTDAAADVFLATLAITLFLYTRNNCVRRESSTMEATVLLHVDPVPNCARRYLHLRKHSAPPNTPICLYYVSVGNTPKYVTGTNIMELLRATEKYIGFQRLGFFPYEIVSRSLRLGGPMTLHQSHISDSNIKIIGRLRSDTLLIYFQGQVAIFTKEVSKAMAVVHWFTHQVPTLGPA